MLKDFKKVIFKNLNQLIKFELIFKLLTVLIFTPIFLNCFKFIMHFTGYSYLTLENAISFITNPITLIALFILLLLIGFYTIFDIGAIIILCDANYQNKKITLKDTVNLAFNKALRIFKIKNLGILLLVLFLIPFLNIGVGTGVITSIKIPEFIMDYIKNNQILLVAFIFLVIFLMYLLLKWLYVLHYYFLEDNNFKEARLNSEKLSNNNKLKDLSRIVLLELSLFIIYLIFIIMGIIGILVLNKIFKRIVILESILITIIVIFILISLIIYMILGTSIGYACISTLFYKHKLENKEKIKHLNIKEYKLVTNKKWHVLITMLIIITFITTSIFVYGLNKGKYNLNIEYIKNMEVTAHRGASSEAPENTMASFIKAKELGASWIELDVQQTKDNEIIVMHDTNFKRTTGINKNTWEVTYDEIKEYDAGSWKDIKYHNERIPLLKDVIKWAKDNNMKLNIELKPTGKEVDFEKNVIDIIIENDFVNDCVVTSQVYNVLENVKKVNKDIITVYVMSLAYGDLLQFKDANYFSIEASSINKKLISKLHKEGREVYGWTVNTNNSINNMINLNVDNIITDDIVLAKKLIIESKSSNLIIEFIKMIQRILG